MLVFKLKGKLKSCRKIINVLDGALDSGYHFMVITFVHVCLQVLVHAGGGNLW